MASGWGGMKLSFAIQEVTGKSAGEQSSGHGEFSVRAYACMYDVHDVHEAVHVGAAIGLLNK